MELQTLLQYVFGNLSSFIAFPFLCIMTTLLYFQWKRRPHPMFPPGPIGVPLLGVTPYFSEMPGIDFKRWSLEKYGPVMSVRLGSEETVILNTFDSIHEAFVKQGNAFSGRPWIELFGHTTKQDGIGLKKYGDVFKAQKHFALKYLRGKGLANKTMEKMVNEEGDKFIKHLKEYEKENQVVDFKAKFHWLTGNVISQTAIGKRLDYKDPKFDLVLSTMSLLFADPKHAFKLTLILVWGALAKVPPFRHSMQVFHKRMIYIMSVIQEQVDEHKVKFDPDNVDDFIDAFIYEQRFGKRPKEHGFTDIQLTTTCRDLFVAGTDTASMFLSWLFVYFLNFPCYHERILQEIDNVLGSSGVPNMAKRSKMPFTCAFIQEVHRMKAVSPFAVKHLTTCDVELFGFVIPKGTTVIPNLQGAFLDPVDWPNPNQFSPERHIDERGRFIPSKKIIPFSLGDRFCLGESLARVEIFIFFVKILQTFRVSCGKSELPPVDKEIFSAVLAPRECIVKLELRN